jgi:hypothetical protein
MQREGLYSSITLSIYLTSINNANQFRIHQYDQSVSYREVSSRAPFPTTRAVRAPCCSHPGTSRLCNFRLPPTTLRRLTGRTQTRLDPMVARRRMQHKHFHRPTRSRPRGQKQKSKLRQTPPHSHNLQRRSRLHSHHSGLFNLPLKRSRTIIPQIHRQGLRISRVQNALELSSLFEHWSKSHSLPWPLHRS